MFCLCRIRKKLLKGVLIYAEISYQMRKCHFPDMVGRVWEGGGDLEIKPQLKCCTKDNEADVYKLCLE